MKEDENTQEEKQTFKEWMKEFFGGGQSAAPTAANFSEADAQRIADAAAANAKEEAKAEFAEELKTRDTQIENLLKSVNASSASGRRSEIVSFVEAIPAEKGKHFLKRAGIVDFMESLAKADETETELAISFSDGDGDGVTEHKFSRLDWFKNYVTSQKSFVEFGEKFGNLTATAEADVAVDTTSVQEMRDAMGIKTDGGAK